MRRRSASIHTRLSRPAASWALAMALAAHTAVATQAAAPSTSGGITVALDVTAEGGGHGLIDGGDARFGFSVSDATGSPFTGLRPAAWLARRIPGAPSCAGKAAKLLEGGLTGKPALDLNGSYVLTMNEDASLSVVDARFSFGGSQLLAMVFLDSPAEDWSLSGDGRHLFVSMPESSRVAVVDTLSWKVLARLATPGRPGRLALEPDEQALWVTYSGAGGEGVAVFDRATLAEVVRIPTGAGPHEIAFSADGRFAFVTNGRAGTVAVIDAAARRKLAEVATGSAPVSIAFSTQAQLAYVAHQGDGIIAAVSGPRAGVVARIVAEPGIGQLRFAPGGRFAFAVNPERDLLHVLDAASNRLVQTGVIHGAPDQVTFSATLAYLRRRGDATVLMVPLAGIGADGAPIPLVDFPGGQRPFGQGALPSPADSFVQVPGANAVLVANPADRAVYYYQEGMAAPMGLFESFGREPRALLIVDRSLGERPGGRYETVGRLPQAGLYDVVFFLDSPRVVQCFELAVAAAPGAPAGPRPVVVHRLGPGTGLEAGERARLRFQILDARTREPIAHLRDLSTLAFLSPGTWQQRQPAVEAAPAVYELELAPPRTGLYYVYFQSPSLGLQLNSPHFLTFTVGVPAIAPGTGTNRTGGAHDE